MRYEPAGAMIYKVEQVHAKRWQVVRVDASAQQTYRVVAECPQKEAAVAAARLLTGVLPTSGTPA